MNGATGYNAALGRLGRLGDWDEQKISTYRKTKEAIEEGRWDDAVALANYFIDEAEVIYRIYRRWVPDLYRFLGRSGVSEAEQASVRERILAKLQLPDGGSFDTERLWAEFRAEVHTFIRHAHRQERKDALDQLDVFKEAWRRLHDREVDHCYGLMNEVVERFGEERLLGMYEEILQPWFATRYEQFDIDQRPWDEAFSTLVYLSIESMRGHLAGPGRTGDVELFEETDRFALRFDPCGSGQRTMRGDEIEGTGSRMGAPYNWGVTTEEHDWAWNTKGICYYCAHCCVTFEQMPIDRFGYPVRVVDPPTEDQVKDKKCTWYVYKDPTAVPRHYYERVGRTKPNAFGSKPQRRGEEQ